MRFGCTPGVLYHEAIPLRGAVQMIADAGANALELSQDTPALFLDDPRTLPVELLGRFEHVSLHAPALTKNPAQTESLLGAISDIHRLHPLGYVVVHPNAIDDRERLRNAGFPVAFENMDVRNATFTTPREMRDLLDAFPEAGMVLDVNHVWTHDHTMGLAREFYDLCGDRIVGVHVSGYEIIHDPLFRTRQDEIIAAIEDLSVPIIIESQVRIGEIATEMAYIRERLKEDLAVLPAANTASV